MQCAYTGPRLHRTFADTAYREHRSFALQRQRPRRNACPSWLELSLHRQPHRTARLNRRPQTSMQAFQRPNSEGSSDPAFSRLPVVDITAETVSTSGRGSDDDRDQRHKPNIVRRAVAAAVGLLQSALQWVQAHLKPWKLFDRSVLAVLLITESCLARQHFSAMLLTCISMSTSGSINVWLSFMQALFAVPYVFCTGLYGDDYSEGGDQQCISKASTRGNLHPAMHLYMRTCSLQQIPLLHATPCTCCCLKGPVLHAAHICGCQSMCLSCVHKSSI